MQKKDNAFKAQKEYRMPNYTIKIQLSEDGKKVRYVGDSSEPSNWIDLIEDYDTDVPEDVEPVIRQSFYADGFDWFIDEFDDIEPYEPQASQCLSNWGGITIQLNDSGDAVRYQYYDNEPSDWVEVQYGIDEEDLTEDGDSRAYFIGNSGTKYYLDEFMRNNYPM